MPASVGAEVERVVDIAFMLPRNKYQIPSDPDAESLASFVKDVTGISISIQRSMIGMYIMLLVVFGILAALVRPVINRLPFLLELSSTNRYGYWYQWQCTCALSRESCSIY